MVAELHRALAHDPTSPTCHYRLARALDGAEGLAARALWHYDEAIAYGFHEGPARLGRGRLRAALGMAGGRDDLRRAARLQGPIAKRARALLQLEERVARLAHAASRGTRDEAIALADALLAKAPQHAVVHFLRGCLLEPIEGREREALGHYDRAVAIGLADDSVHYHRGRLRLALQEKGGFDDLLAARGGGRWMRLGAPLALRDSERRALRHLDAAGAHHELARHCALLLREWPQDAELNALHRGAQKALGRAPEPGRLARLANRARRASRPPQSPTV